MAAHGGEFGCPHCCFGCIALRPLQGCLHLWAEAACGVMMLRVLPGQKRQKAWQCLQELKFEQWSHSLSLPEALGCCIISSGDSSSRCGTILGPWCIAWQHHVS